MKAMAFVLLLGVFIAHNTANWLSEGSRFTPAAWFYMLQGAWTVVLSACLLIIFLVAKFSIWRSLCIAAMVISMIEGSMVTVCRLAVSDISAVPRGANLCDHVTGLPVGAVMVALYLLIISWNLGKWGGGRK